MGFLNKVKRHFLDLLTWYDVWYNQNMLASHIQKYFWDVNSQKSRPKSHPEYYIKCILELGDSRAFEWLKMVFGLQTIKKIARKAKLSPKAKNYWRIKLNV